MSLGTKPVREIIRFISILCFCRSDDVVNPAQIKGFGQSELTRTKTDKADSKLIARFCQAINPQLWKPIPINVRELRSFVKRLEDLQKIEGEELNRLEVSKISRLCRFKP